MRRLPVRTLGFGPAFVEGLAVVRGAPVPVVNLGRLLGDERSLAAVRFVSVKLDTRAAVLGVDAVVGTRALDQSALDALPPLLREAQQQTVETLSTLDNELLIVLAGARLLPEAFWEEWGRRGANA